MISARTRNRLINEITLMGISDERILEIMREVPRHIFVDSGMNHRAYENIPLPIGYGQTISQPYTVARITDLVVAALKRYNGKFNKVLEIGAGCGYQAAVLGHLFDKVYAVERIKPLYEMAQENIKKLGMKNITFSYGDGFEGFKKHAPFDAVVVSAATDNIPYKSFKQLNNPGCIIFPMGTRESQKLTMLVPTGDKLMQNFYDQVTFVPMLPGLESKETAKKLDENLG